MPRVVIDLKNVEALRYRIVEADSCIRVGALTVMTELIRDTRVRRFFPALVEAASVVGSVQIRNRATLAGNVCNASPAADTAPALLAYAASVNITGMNGKRSVPVSEFFTGPGRTVLDRAEIVDSIDLPLPDGASGAAFGRVTRRRGVDLASINLCCRIDASGSVRLAYGALGPRPFLIEDTSGVLIAKRTDRGEYEAAMEDLVQHASPISDVRGSAEYRLAMMKVMTRRVLDRATERLEGGNR
jgi:carbon-monoxide dehydrogenase medium subunit